jgi:hypothetical protein
LRRHENYVSTRSNLSKFSRGDSIQFYETEKCRNDQIWANYRNILKFKFKIARNERKILSFITVVGQFLRLRTSYKLPTLMQQAETAMADPNIDEWLIQIETRAKEKLGDQWIDDVSWSEYVKSVVLGLYTHTQGGKNLQ